MLIQLARLSYHLRLAQGTRRRCESLHEGPGPRGTAPDTPTSSVKPRGSWSRTKVLIQRNPV